MPLSSKIYASILLMGIALICLACLLLRWRILAADNESPRIGLERSAYVYSDPAGQPRPETESGAQTESASALEDTELPDEAAAAADESLDLNRATAAELDELPGIGPVLAARIIETRERLGGFSSAEDLLEVEGIGASKFEELRPLIFISP